MMKILLVGKESDARQLEGFLHQHMVKTIEVFAVDLQSAVDSAREQQPDMVILNNEIIQGNMGFLQELKALDKALQLLVLAESDERNLTVIFGHDADFFLLKPVQEIEFVSLVRAAAKTREKIKLLCEKESDLLEEAERFRKLLDFSPDWDCLLDTTGNYSYVSPSCEQISGYRPAEFIKDPGLLESITHPDDHALFKEHTQKSLQSSEQMNLEFRIIHRNGEERWISQICQPFSSGEGQFLGRRSSNRDITTQKQLEAELKKSEEKYRHESELVEGILNGIPDIIGLQCPDHTIIRYNQAGYAFFGKTPEEVQGKECYELFGRNERCDLCATTLALKSKKIEVVEKYFPEMGLYLECRSNPILDSEGRVKIIVEQLRDITAQKLMEHAVRESEANLRRITDNMQDLISQTDITGVLIYVSPSHKQILGYDQEELMGKSAFDLLHPDDAENILPAFREGIERKAAQSAEFRMRHAEGHYVWLEIVGKVLQGHSGSVTGALFTGRNISKRKLAEEERDRLFNLSIDMMCVANMDGYLIELNPAWEKTLGWKPEELKSRPYLEFVHPYDRESTGGAAQGLTVGKPAVSFTNRYRCKDGSYRWLSWNSLPLLDNQLIYCVVRDVTVLKETEEALQKARDELEQRVKERTLELQQANEELKYEINERLLTEKTLQESEERYRTLIENIPIGIYRNTPGLEGRFLMANPAFLKIFDIESEAELQKLKVTDLYANPDDRETFSDSLKRQGKVTGYELRLKRLDGTPIWGAVTANTVRGAGGKVIYFDSTIEDITRRKEAEVSLQQRLEEMEVLYKISRTLRGAEKLDEMLSLLLDETLSVLNAEAGLIRLYHPSSGELSFAAARGWFTQLKKATIKAGEGIAGAVFKTGKPYLSREFAADPLFKAPDRAQIPQGWGGVCLPIRMAEVIVGALYISAPLPREITGEELVLLTSLTEMAGAAVHRVSLHEETIRRLEQVQALRNIDMAITGSLDLRVTFQVVLDEITRLLQVDAAAILRLDPYTGMLQYEAWRGFHSADTRTINMRLGEGFGGRSAMDRKPILIPDLREMDQDPVQGPLLEKEGFYSYYAVPLIAKGFVQGVLEVFHRKPLTTNSEWLEFLETLAGQAAIAIDNAELFHKLERSNIELLQAYDTTIEGWAHAIDLRDKETEGHSRRVTDLTIRIAEKVGMRQKELAHVRRGALLHDIGKMGIPDCILLKPGKLTKDEWEIMYRHPSYAYEMLLPIAYLRPALDIPCNHHERWDGTGYPRRIKGKQIPLAARIFAVVDVYDALTSDRPYRPALSREKALDHIREQTGKHFDPEVVEVFLEEMEQAPSSPGCTKSTE